MVATHRLDVLLQSFSAGEQLEALGLSAAFPERIQMSPE